MPPLGGLATVQFDNGTAAVMPREGRDRMAILKEELLALETSTFEICDVADTGTDLATMADAVVAPIDAELAAAWCSSSCSCSSCCSCSTSSCCSSSTSTGCGG
ncbi:hypothetical protein GCM10027290_03040 [Micromonospora sonneratiae]